MLVLSRKQNQEIIIGDNIKITILKTKGNTVRIGIEAPRDVSVRRGELPKKSDAPIASIDESEECDDSGYTVVFSNSNETSSATADVIPFERESKSGPRSESKTDSVQFHGQIPQSFQHNRLKEIVGRLTASPAKTDPSNV
jgi:carbon storage regulator CsrA